jgi:hypothetical protein
MNTEVSNIEHAPEQGIAPHTSTLEPVRATVRGPEKRRPSAAVDRSHHAQFQAKISAMRDAMWDGETPVEGSAHPQLAKLPTLQPLPVLTVALVTFAIACVAGCSLLFWMFSAD